MKIRRIFTGLMAMILLLSAFSFATSAASNLLGDVNGNGKIDSLDYMLLKRCVLKTTTLNEEQLLRADVNKNGKPDALDYGMVKRHVLKKYVITGEVTPKSATEKIVSAIGKNGKISLDFSGTISTFKGNATVSFVTVNGALSLKGKAVTDQGIIVEMTIPMSSVAKEYSFSGSASMKMGTQTIVGSCNGSMVAATYSIDQTSFDDVSFTCTPNIFGPAQIVILEGYCKEAMDQFLYKANELLAKEGIKVTIGDLGFTNYLDEINKGWVKF